MKSLKNNAGQSFSSSEILENCDMFLLWVRLGGADDCQTKTNKFAVNFAVNFSKILDEEELCPALFFSDFMLLNVIQDWTKKIFY